MLTFIKNRKEARDKKPRTVPGLIPVAGILTEVSWLRGGDLFSW